MSNYLNLEQQKQCLLAIAFLSGEATDNHGNHVSSYLEMDDEEMEYDHQWIQHAFPIDTISPHNPQAPCLFPGYENKFIPDTAAFANRKALTVNFLNFLGIDFLRKTVDENKFFDVVDGPYNHNIKRISRLLKHWCITGGANRIEPILHILMRLVLKNPDNFSSYTVAYWNATVYDYLHLVERD